MRSINPLPTLLRAVVVVAFLAATSGGPPPFCQESAGFFEDRKVDFWQDGGAPEAAPLFPDAGKMPAAVRRLVENPTVGNARAYLRWQKERMRRLAAVIAALKKARAQEAPVYFFTKPGCPHCTTQEKILRAISRRVVRLRPGDRPELWKAHGISSVPAVVAGGRVFRGVTPREEIERALGGEP
ncbi:MAG: glutaredoxin family protein [Planctomycetota bacterium]|jgi:glutaredoxin